MKKKPGERKGFTLVVVILSLAIVSILAFTIIGVASSTFKMAKVDSRSQSTYYIAEAGVNASISKIKEKADSLSKEELSHEEFFDKLDKYMAEDLKLVTGFEENFNEVPLARISIDDKEVVKEESLKNSSEKLVSYKINSQGEIGKSRRRVSSLISIGHKIEGEENKGGSTAFDYVLFSGGDKTLNNSGGAVIEGSVYAHDIKFEASNTIIDGSLISEKSVDLLSAVKINGNVYAMDGEVNLSNSNIKMDGDINASDRVSLSHGSSLKGNIYTNGQVELKSSDVRVLGDINSIKGVRLGSTSKVERIYTSGDIDFLSNNAVVSGDIHGGGDISFGPGTSVRDIYLLGNIKFASNNTIDGHINIEGNVGDNKSGGGVKINGHIFSNGSVITRSYQRYDIYGNIDGRLTIENGNGNNIYGNVVSGKGIVNNGTINGSIKENGNPISPKPPLPPKAPDFKDHRDVSNEISLNTYEIGDIDINAGKNSTIHNVLPGTYKNLELKWNDTIKFEGGSYYFNSIRADSSAIKLKLDLSKGPINIYAKKNISFASGLKVYVSEDGINYREVNEDFIKNNKSLAIELAGKVYWETYSDFKLAENTCFIGSILANNNFTAGSSVKLVGAYAVNKGTISMGYGPQVIYGRPTTSEAGNNEDNEDQGNTGPGKLKGENTIAKGDRIRIRRPIRED